MDLALDQGLVLASAQDLVQDLGEQMLVGQQELQGIVGRVVRRHQDDLEGHKAPGPLVQKIGKYPRRRAAMLRGERAAGLQRQQEFEAAEARVTPRLGRWLLRQD